MDDDTAKLGANTGMVADFGVAQPGSPADAMGTSVPAPSGGVGALDVGEGGDTTGDDQKHDHGIVDEQMQKSGETLKPRLTSDVEPGTSNLAGPTDMEEGHDS